VQPSQFLSTSHQWIIFLRRSCTMAVRGSSSPPAGPIPPAPLPPPDSARVSRTPTAKKGVWLAPRRNNIPAPSKHSPVPASSSLAGKQSQRRGQRRTPPCHAGCKQLPRIRLCRSWRRATPKRYDFKNCKKALQRTDGASSGNGCQTPCRNHNSSTGAQLL